MFRIGDDLSTAPVQPAAIASTTATVSTPTTTNAVAGVAAMLRPHVNVRDSIRIV